MPKNRAQARDRNKPRGEKERGGEKPQDQDGKGEKQKGGKKQKDDLAKSGKEDNTKQNPKEGSNEKGGEPGKPEEVRVGRKNLSDRWGVLPEELRQKLIHRDFKDYTPEYEAKIRAYLKKITTPRKRR